MFSFSFYAVILCLAASAAADGCSQQNSSESCCSHEWCSWTNCSTSSQPITFEYFCVNITLLELNDTVSTEAGNFTCLASEVVCSANVSTPGPVTETVTLSINSSDATTNPVTGANSTWAATTTPAATTEQVTTTQPVVTTASNILPTANPQVQAEQDCSGRRFDGASFIGGIVLCGGFVLIGAFIYKYYQSRVEARYHQF